MSGSSDAPGASIRARGDACAECLRRSWLLSALSGPLDCCARDRDRLRALLALEDAELIEAVGGRRRAELFALYDAFSGHPPGESVNAKMAHHTHTEPNHSRTPGILAEAVCRHDPRYPRALLGAQSAPHMLNVLGGVNRLSSLCSAPAAAILGSPRASDYGRTVARGLARGLSASGVSVICPWQDGIAAAAIEGALETGDAAVAVVGDGLDVTSPVRRRGLLDRLARVGCAVSELPCGCNGRRWAKLASERAVVTLATVAIVVEAEQTAGDLAAVELARALGRTVAAVPGRVTSPLSSGTNALLKDGARTAIETQDVLELLYEADPSRTGAPPMDANPREQPRAPLEPRLRNVMERVGAGSDTPDSLARDGMNLGDALAALSELELMGLLGRGDGGRYLPTAP